MHQIFYNITCFFSISAVLRGQRIGKYGEMLCFSTSLVSMVLFFSKNRGSLLSGVSLSKSPQKKELDPLSLGTWNLLVQMNVTRNKNEDEYGFSAFPRQTVVT